MQDKSIFLKDLISKKLIYNNKKNVMSNYNTHIMIQKIKLVIVSIVFFMLSTSLEAQITQGSDTNGKYYDVVIDGPDANLAVTIAKTGDIRENNATTGKVNIVPSGGTPPYKYFLYRSGSTTAVRSGEISTSGGNKEEINLGHGTYYVDIYDAKYSGTPPATTFNSSNCNSKRSGNAILANPQKLEVQLSVSQIIKCNGDSGSIKVEARGGTQPTANSGEYLVELFVGSSSTPLKTTTMTFSATTYQNVIFTGISMATNLTETTYKVKVTDRYHDKEETQKLLQPTVLTLPIANISNTLVTCFGGSDGTIKVTPVGGTKPYKVYLNGALLMGTFDVSKTITGQKAGNYTIQIEDSRQCKTALVTGIKINQPMNDLKITKIDQQNTTSVGATDGFIEFKVEGGTVGTGYDYEFKGTTSSAKNKTGKITSDGGTVKFENLPEDTYTFKVTDSKGCSKTPTSVDIDDPKPLVLQVVDENPTCFGRNGKITINVTGGFTNIYRYEWLKKQGTSFVSQGIKTNSESVPDGDYRVKVSVISGSTVVEDKTTSTIEIRQPSQITVSAPTIQHVGCKGSNTGSITLGNVTGGTPLAGNRYNYSWSNGKTTKDITGLTAGDYEVTITDAVAGCSITRKYTVEEPVKALNVALVQALDPTIHSSDLNGVIPDGRITVNVTEGWKNYTYKWTDASGKEVGTDKDLINVGPGIYTLEVIDSDGRGSACVDTSITEQLFDPEVLEITITITPGGELFCNGDSDGSLQVNVKGGTNSYTYAWYEFESASRNFISGETNTTISKLDDGVYGVEVTMINRNGTQVKNYPKTDFPLKEPSKLVFDMVNTKENEIKCFGEKGSIDLRVTGGVGDYVYFISKDSGAFNTVGIPFTATNTTSIPNLGEGIYRVRVQDKNTCDVKKVDGTIETLSFSLVEPTALKIDAVNTKHEGITGFGLANGKIDIVAEDGTAPYYYRYSKDNGTYTAWVSFNPSTTISNLDKGDYKVQIKDANDCVLKESGTQKTLEFKIEEPAELIVNFTTNPVFTRCNGEKTIVNPEVKGGLLKSGEDYQYEWRNVATGAVVSRLMSLTEVAGTYSLKVTDSYGNVSKTRDALGAVIPSEVVIQDNPKVVVKFTQVDVKCKGDNTGSITVSPEGGTGNYDYIWRHDSTLNTGSLTDLTAGKYYVKVTDKNGCFDAANQELEVEILEPTNPLTVDTANTSSTDATGFGEADAFIELSINGGTAPYFYRYKKDAGAYGVWTSFTSMATINTLTKGDYEVEIKDSNDCPLKIAGVAKALEFKIREPDELLVSFSTNPVITRCNGETVTITPTVTGGLVKTGDTYKYEWKNTATGTVVSRLSTLTEVAGTYSLIVTDSNGNVSKSRDISGAIISSEVVIRDNPKVVVKFTQVDIKCKGESTGSIMITPEGGTGNYNYSWRHDASLNTGSLSGLAAGKYYVKVTDDNGCFDAVNQELEVEIIEPTTVISVNTASEVITNATGFGVSDGTITVLGQGGTPFVDASGNAYYEYSLKNKTTGVEVSTSSTTTTLAGSETGMVYIMTITDANNCSVSKEYTIIQPSELLVELSVSSTIKCNGENGTLSSSVTGGFLNSGNAYDYKWYNVSDLSTVVGTNTTLTAKSGTYRLVVTDSNGNVSKSRDISGAIIPSEETLSENPVLEITYTATDITNVTCYNGSDASIDITVTGGTGTGTYVYEWSNGDRTEDISGLVAGDYTVTVTDNNGCKDQVTITITQPNEYKIETKVFKRPTGAGLSNGEITIEVLGGTMPFTYKWTDETGAEVGDTASIQNITAGKYELLVTDDRGCEVRADFNLGEPDPLLISIKEIGAKQCNGDAAGVLELETSGGVGGNAYTWYNASTNVVIGSTVRISNVLAGDYYVKVVDAENNETISTTYTIVEPTLLAVTSNSKDLSCFESNNGEITLSASLATPPYYYRYQKDSGGYGAWIEFTSTTTINGLAIGNYQVQVKDDKDCFLKDVSGFTQTLDFTVTQPDVLQLTDITKPATGFGLSNGSVDITITGGTTPYTFVWKDASGGVVANTEDISNLTAGTYSLELEDAQGCILTDSFVINQPDLLLISIKEIGAIQCNGDSSGTLELETSGGIGGNTYTWFNAITNTPLGGNTTSVSNLSAGDYYVKVVDANNNEATSTTYTIIQPTLLQVTTSKKDLSCFESADGTINISASQGTPGYLYRYRKDGGNYGTWIAFSGTISISGLSIGDYEVQVKDTNDCLLKESGTVKTISYTLTQPNLLEVSEVITDVTGNGLNNGSIDITVVGGTTPYTFVWKDVSGGIVANTEDISSLVAGTYTLDLEDAQGCTVNKTYTITEPDALKVTTTQQTIVLCKGDTTASILSIVTGGIAPYGYEWYIKGNANVQSTTNSISNIGIGTYYVIVTDAKNNVVQSADLTITEPGVLEVDLAPVSAGCGTDNDWTITANVKGGTPPFRYFWNTGERTATIQNKSLGTYFVFITDANGCQVTENVVLENNSPLSVQETITDIICFDACSGGIDLAIGGGVAPYTITWDSGQTTSSLTGLCSGDYTVEVTDLRGCSIIKTFTLKNPQEFVFELVPDEVTLCAGEFIEYDVTMSGIANYDWTSDNGFTSNESIVTLDESGAYTLTVTTDKGCTITKTLTVTKSDVEIDAQLILTSQAFVGEDIAIINVSDPISSTVEWEIPSNVTVIQKENEGLVVRFPAPGNYNIGLVSIEGNCIKKDIKTVNVLKERVLPDVGDTEGPFVKKFEVYANPNKGQFKAEIELEKEAQVSLRLFGLGANTINDDKVLKGNKEYLVDYDMKAPAGIYILLLETAKTKRIRKVVIE